MTEPKNNCSLTIGALTYDDIDYTLAWANSVIRNLPDSLREQSRIVVVDDGTPDYDLVERLDKELEKCNVDLIAHFTNRGMGAGWNTIANAYRDTELICIFNNDTRINSPDTFPCAIYFMEHNPFVGVSYWPMVYVYPDGHKSLWFPEGYYPCIDRQPAGYAFFVRREAFDKSRWFREDRMDDGGDWDFGFEMYRIGYEVIRMPFPPIEHWHGPKGLGRYTFDRHPELQTMHASMPCVRRSRSEYWWPNSGGCEEAIVQYIQPSLNRQRIVKWLGPEGKPCQKVIPETLPGKLVVY